MLLSKYNVVYVMFVNYVVMSNLLCVPSGGGMEGRVEIARQSRLLFGDGPVDVGSEVGVGASDESIGIFG